MLDVNRKNCSGLMTSVWAVILVALLSLFIIPSVRAADNVQKSNSSKVMEAFERQAEVSGRERELNDKQKHLIMFVIGAPLLILLVITASLGIAMGIYGKQVFLLHIIFAGLTVTLSFVHVIAGLVWFYPF